MGGVVVEGLRTLDLLMGGWLPQGTRWCFRPAYGVGRGHALPPTLLGEFPQNSLFPCRMGAGRVFALKL